MIVLNLEKKEWLIWLIRDVIN